MKICEHNWKRMKEYENYVLKHCVNCGKDQKFITKYATTGSLSFGSKGIPGYSAPGYNQGLGKVVTSKSDYRSKAKEAGAIPVD